MNRLKPQRVLALAGLGLCSLTSQATEGGGLGIYPDGLENFLSGALPPPGVHGLVYGGFARYDKVRDHSGNAIPIPGFKVDVAVVAPRIVWVTDTQLFGGQLAFYAIAPLLDVKFQAGGASFKRSGLGDIAFGPAIGFHASQSLHDVVAVDLIAPTGEYSQTDPSSLGRNHWAVQPLLAVSLINPAGLNADAKLMYDINLENGKTKTTSGQALHADYALGWGFGSWVAGIGGHVFLQTTADSGPASAAGKARAIVLSGTLDRVDPTSAAVMAAGSAARLEASAGAMRELSELVARNADAATSVNDAAVQALSQAMQGQALVARSADAMTHIAQESLRVGALVDTIDQISVQTGLLALNAAVQAANAGAAGRSFGVLAQEVRALSARSADSARAARAMLGEMGKGIQAGNERSAQAVAAMATIGSTCAQLVEGSEGMAAASRAQAAQVSLCADQVHELDHASQQITQVVVQHEAEAAQIRELAHSLNAGVAIFQLG